MMSGLTQSASIAPPAPGVLRVIRPSAGRLTQLEDVFTQQLHYEVVGLIPDLASHLAGADWTFCQRTVQALLWAALTDEPPHVVAGALRRLGVVNRMAGFPEGQYLGLAHALLRAVRELTDDDWSTTLGSAWISYFQWIQGHLVAGAQQAPRPAPPQPPSRPQPAGPAGAAGAVGSAGTTGLAGSAGAGSPAWPTGRTGPGGPGGPDGPDGPDGPGGARPYLPAPAPPGGVPQPEDAEAELETVAGLLEDEDDEDTGYGQIMVSMTRAARRGLPQRPD
jgi:hypothetical protein